MGFGGLGWKMGSIRKEDKIGVFTRDYADVIGRNQIRGSKMAVQRRARMHHSSPRNPKVCV